MSTFFANILRLTTAASPVFPSLPSNFFGSVVLGVLFSLQREIKEFSEPFYLGLSTGFCGSFTTLSGWMQDTSLLFLHGESSLNFSSHDKRNLHPNLNFLFTASYSNYCSA